jgi:hypothetical protein
MSQRTVRKAACPIARDGSRVELNAEQQSLLAELSAELGERHDAPLEVPAGDFAVRVGTLLGEGKSNAYRDLLEARLSRLVLGAQS